MHIQLTSAQLNSLRKGKKVNYNPSKTPKGKTHDIELDDKLGKKVASHAKRGKAIQISGGDIIGDFTKGVKKTANDIGDGVKSLTKKATNAKNYKKVSKLSSNLIKNAEAGLKVLSTTAKEQDWGGKVEMVKKAVPKSIVKEGIKGALIASGMDETSANVAAGSASGALYEYDFGEAPSKKNAMNAAKGGVEGGVKAGVSGKGIDAPEKGIKVAIDAVKRPRVRGGAFMKASKPVKVAKKVSGIAKAKSKIKFDPNLEFGKGEIVEGGSFKEIKGSSFKAHGEGVSGGSFKSVGSGVGRKPKFAKGSQEMKNYMASLRAKRK